MRQIDLEHFPTDETAQRMMARISPIYEKSYVGKWLFQVMGAEMGEVRALYEELRLQAFPETATWGLMYWEQRYGLPFDESMPIGDRRRAVNLRRQRKAPMNPEKLRQLVEQATGVDARITENVSPYTFEVTLASIPGNITLENIQNQIKRVKPSHQSFTITFEQSTSMELYSGGAFVWGREFDMRLVN